MTLLEKLSDAQKKQAAAKASRDAKPNDSSAQSDYERATEDMRNAEKALEDFNNKYGKEIEKYADKLISQYEEEKESHEKPLRRSAKSGRQLQEGRRDELLIRL